MRRETQVLLVQLAAQAFLALKEIPASKVLQVLQVSVALQDLQDSHSRALKGFKDPLDHLEDQVKGFVGVCHHVISLEVPAWISGVREKKQHILLNIQEKLECALL